MTFDESFSNLIKAAVTEAFDQFVKKNITESLPNPIKKNETVEHYFNLNGAANYMCTTRQSLTTYMKNGVVKFYRLNGSPRFKKSDLDAAMIPITVKLYKS